MVIKAMTMDDKSFVMSIDKRVSDKRYEDRVLTKSGYVIWEEDERIGILYHSVIWEKLPFLNSLHVVERHRNKGYGGAALLLWEEEMRKEGYKMVLLSTQVDERAQHLYRRLGYVDCGGLAFHDTPFDQPLELFMHKVL